MFEQQTLLVTGGTGSFGHNFIKLALDEHNPARVVVYSRDEKKQHDMRLLFNDDRLQFVIGDVRDRYQVSNAMRGVDYVFHAAALKQVPSCEFFPMEAVRTNVLGTDNVLSAAESEGVKKVVVLSTDKAVYPVNAMGMTKALLEKVMTAKARATNARSTYCGVRYGNVMYSRGSVIPLFVQQIRAGQPITITDTRMTRLLLPLSEAVRLVTFAMEHAGQGDIFVRKAPAATMVDLAEALMNLFDRRVETKIIGIREGEKIHEVLVSPEDLAVSEEYDEHFRIPSLRTTDYDAYFSRGVQSRLFLTDGYTSENAERLSVKQVEQLLLQLPEVREELGNWNLEPSLALRKRVA
jgi:UDP-glucose 4-epimerase